MSRCVLFEMRDSVFFFEITLSSPHLNVFLGCAILENSFITYSYQLIISSVVVRYLNCPSPNFFFNVEYFFACLNPSIRCACMRCVLGHASIPITRHIKLVRASNLVKIASKYSTAKQTSLWLSSR